MTYAIGSIQRTIPPRRFFVTLTKQAHSLFKICGRRTTITSVYVSFLRHQYRKTEKHLSLSQHKNRWAVLDTLAYADRHRSGCKKN